MRIIADLHLHSKYSRAVSEQMVLPTIAEWAVKKGIGLVGTGDFTHPLWFREIQSGLEEVGNGVYRLRTTDNSQKAVDGRLSTVSFLLTTEISCIYSDKGKGRRVHVLIFLPKIADVEKFNQGLTGQGANLFSDGRPIVGLSLHGVAQIALEASPQALIIPAHAWTPWFGIYGTNSGYDSLEEAFGGLTANIPAVETGLSSDPAMNWRMEELANRAIVSFSDAHSPAKIGREATVFELPEISFENIRKLNVAHTIEFYPEEGKYHYSGHRNCGIVYSPLESKKSGTVCPVCGRPLTPGVMSRVESLGGAEVKTEVKKDKLGVRWIYPQAKNRPPYVTLVPLLEILAEAFGVGAASQKVTNNYELITNDLGPEFKVLLETPFEEIKKIGGERVAEAISKVRAGEISIKPGYDGVFGKVKIWSDTSPPEGPQSPAFQQKPLF